MIQIRDFRHDYDGSSGDHLVVQLGADTKVIIDTGSDHLSTPDLRVDSRATSSTYKLELDAEDYSVQRVLKDDFPMTAQH